MTKANFFDRIQSHYEAELPFVAYNKPNGLNLKGIFQQDNTLYKTFNFSEQGFIMSPFDDRQDTILMPLEKSEVVSVPFIVDSLDDFKDVLISTSEGKSTHVNLVKKGIEAISKGKLEKVVLSRSIDVPIIQSSFIQMFKNLLSKYPKAFVYCWYHPKVGLWLGATPETLMHIEGKRFSIMALAGTQDANNGEKTIWQAKEKEEQQFVTDFILKNISPSIENIKVSDAETSKAGNLLHLKTRIQGTINESCFNLKSLLQDIHPTPAVCGLPKEEAKQFILENEDYNREFYTGFLGELNFEKQIASRSARRNIENRAYTFSKNCTQLYVNLRCAKVETNKAVIFVGGGITEKSIAEDEWEETVSKSKIIKSVL